MAAVQGRLGHALQSGIQGGGERHVLPFGDGAAILLHDPEREPGAPRERNGRLAELLLGDIFLVQRDALGGHHGIQHVPRPVGRGARVSQRIQG